MVQALKVLREQEYTRVSLSVTKANERAVGLYRSMAVTIASENYEDYVMVKKLVYVRQALRHFTETNV